MEAVPVLTIDACRELWRKARELFEQYELDPDYASIVMRCLAEAGSTALFDECAPEVRQSVLHDLRHYRRTGKRELAWIGGGSAGRREDGREQARAAIATLAAAGRIPPSMTRIGEPLPKFMGLELIRGAEALQERRACGDALLDIELVALAQDVPNPRGYPQRWTMKLLITEHERVMLDARGYRREPVRSCVATFALHEYVSMYFWPRFTFGHVDRMRVIQEQLRRGKTRLVVKLDLDGKGRLYCSDMELVGLEEISCAMP